MSPCSQPTKPRGRTLQRGDRTTLLWTTLEFSLFSSSLHFTTICILCGLDFFNAQTHRVLLLSYCHLASKLHRHLLPKSGGLNLGAQSYAEMLMFVSVSPEDQTIQSSFITFQSQGLYSMQVTRLKSFSDSTNLFFQQINIVSRLRI